VKFIVLIISLALIQYWGNARPLHSDGWFRDWVQRLSGSGLGSGLVMAMAILLPVVLLYWLLGFTSGFAYGAVNIAAGIVLLLYSFGREDFDDVIDRYREFCRAGNFEAAYQYAINEMPFHRAGECPGEPEQLHRWMKQTFCYQGFQRWFAVVFYFALLGVPAAVGYRLLQLYVQDLEDDADRELARRVLHVVDWLPSRLLIFAFAVAGDWVGSREQLSASLSDFDTPADESLAAAAHAALGLKATVFVDNEDAEAFAQVSEWEVDQVRSLLSRSAIAWVVAISLLVVFL
jgi:AmpE protein